MRIWFNRGFSLAAIARAMMAADPRLQVIVSVGPGLPIHPGAHETWIEPALDPDAYVGWVRAQIVAHDIDLFIPTSHRALLATADLPCRVHLPTDSATLALLDDKLAFAQAIADEPFHLPTQAIDGADQLRAALDALADRPDRPDDICVKPRLGVNGHGFWRLTRDAPLAHIMNPDAREMHADMFVGALIAQQSAMGSLPAFVLMPFLPGPEVSFDLLCHHGQILKYVARTKHEGQQRLETRHALEADVARLVARFALHGMANVQFRRAHDGAWKALEINARPAGGAVYGEAFGAGLLGDWGGLLSDRLTPDAVSRPELDVTIALTATMTTTTARAGQDAGR